MVLGDVGLQGLQRRNVAQGLQLRRTTALGQRACGVLANHEDVLVARHVERQHGLAVLQQHDALLANLSAGLVVGFGTLVADDLVGIHGGAEDESQHTAHLAVEHGHGYAALTDELFEGFAQVVVVVGKLRLLDFAVSTCTHLDVQTARSGLIVVSGTAPVADECTVPLPFTLQDAVEQRVALAAVDPLPVVI